MEFSFWFLSQSLVVSCALRNDPRRARQVQLGSRQTSCSRIRQIVLGASVSDVSHEERRTEEIATTPSTGDAYGQSSRSLRRKLAFIPSLEFKVGHREANIPILAGFEFGAKVDGPDVMAEAATWGKRVLVESKMKCLGPGWLLLAFFDGLRWWGSAPISPARCFAELVGFLPFACSSFSSDVVAIDTQYSPTTWPFPCGPEHSVLLLMGKHISLICCLRI